MQWNSDAFGDQEEDILAVQLVGYRENGTQVHWTILHTFTTNLQGVNHYDFNPAEHSCTGSLCDQYSQGFIRVCPQAEMNKDNPSRLVSPIVPIGWFVRNAMMSAYGNSWPETKCNQWADTDSHHRQWVDFLPLCPCSLSQAYGDFGGWIPDPGCNMKNQNNRTNCFFHPQALHCVRSMFPTANDGSGAQCCYNSDGYLIYAQDTTSGGTAERSHPFGLISRSTPPNVPTLSHWVHDVIPCFHCCIWGSDEKCFEHYLRLRPTKNCKDHKPAKYGMVYGDPHFQTFDGTKYTFNGRAEFWLFRVQGISVQGRFEQAQQPDGSAVNATILTAIVADIEDANAITNGLDDGSRVTVYKNRPAETRKLRVLVGTGSPNSNQDVDLSKSNNRYLDYGDVKIINNDEPNDVSQSNITIAFLSGAAIRVAYTPGHLLHVIISVPRTLFGKTEGLLGLYNDNPADDLKPPNNENPVTPDPPGYQVVHRDFGMKWVVAKNESKFQYLSNFLNWNYYHHPNFQPSFGPPSTQPPDWMLTCGNNMECEYDFKSTQSQVLAKDTLKAWGWISLLAESSKPTNSCGLLDVLFAIKSNTSYILGNTVEITGCRLNYTLTGTTRYSCVMQNHTASWSPPVDASCSRPSPARTPPNNSQLVIGIMVTGFLVLALILSLLAFFIYKGKNDVTNETQEEGIGCSGSATGGEAPLVEMGASELNQDPARGTFPDSDSCPEYEPCEVVKDGSLVGTKVDSIPQ